ncbi:unnamed protein product [marine sediment metagenome]|uniref:Cupin fold metalloprotein WbuC cupin domain-containing protein n=1 Tax=marine sediment metagenome TaxID=412755 RepID=X0XU91_9ZZZZ
MMIDFHLQKKESDEVYLSRQKALALGKTDIERLVDLATRNIRQRIRFCSHSVPQEPVHEMFIVHPKGAYVRPHKHLNKSESMIVLEGEVDYVILEEYGTVENVISMGDYLSGKPFYRSIRPELFHMLLIRSEWLVFLEITKGPFIKEDTIMADWSPEESDKLSVKKYLENLLIS